MNTLTLHLPPSLYAKIKELAEADGISVDQFLATAAAEKAAALLTASYLKQEAARGRREDFETVLNSVPAVPPDEQDRVKEG